MKLRERIESTEGLTGLSTWHNGEDWVCAAQVDHGLTELGHGATAGAAMLAALMEVEEHRGKTPAERHPELAPRLEALRKSHPEVMQKEPRNAHPEVAEPACLDYDGY